jgi:hypothetical protein
VKYKTNQTSFNLTLVEMDYGDMFQVRDSGEDWTSPAILVNSKQRAGKTPCLFLVNNIIEYFNPNTRVRRLEYTLNIETEML